MLVKNLEVSEVRAINLDHQRKKITVQILFTNDTPLKREILLQKNTQPIAESLLAWVKHEKQPQEDPNEDVLAGVIITNIVGDEELRDKIAHGLFKVYQKLDNVRYISTAREYMSVFNQLKTAQEVIYQKKS